MGRGQWAGPPACHTEQSQLKEVQGGTGPEGHPGKVMVGQLVLAPAQREYGRGRGPGGGVQDKMAEEKDLSSPSLTETSTSQPTAEQPSVK